MEAIRTLLPVFGIFIPALILPGPDFIGVVRSSMTRGAAGGLRTTIGVSVGLGLYATLSLLGLSAVLVEYQWLTWAVRLLGSAYLIYLGIRLLRAKPIQAGNGNAAGSGAGECVRLWVSGHSDKPEGDCSVCQRVRNVGHQQHAVMAHDADDLSGRSERARLVFDCDFVHVVRACDAALPACSPLD